MKPVAFIPLRAGGSRVGKIDGLDKERANFAGYPLMAYTIRAAIDSGVFDSVIAVVRSEEHAVMAESYGAIAPWRRPFYTVSDSSPDIEWVKWAISKLQNAYSAFAILRVTSPFRGLYDIRSAWLRFSMNPGADSLRMVRPVTEHPGKMWIERDNSLLPLLPMETNSLLWHSSPTQSLFKAYIQTAGMEFAHFNTVRRTNSISGSRIIPYFAEAWTGFDINTREEWDIAERAAMRGIAKLPEIE